MSHVVQVVQVPQVQQIVWKIVEIPENSHFRASDL